MTTSSPGAQVVTVTAGTGSPRAPEPRRRSEHPPPRSPGWHRTGGPGPPGALGTAGSARPTLPVLPGRLGSPRSAPRKLPRRGGSILPAGRSRAPGTGAPADRHARGSRDARDRSHLLALGARGHPGHSFPRRFGLLLGARTVLRARFGEVAPLPAPRPRRARALLVTRGLRRERPSLYARWG